MAKNPKKDITLNDLAVSIDNLAALIAKGFENTELNFAKMDDRVGGLENRMGSLEDGQEEIKLRLDNVAYRFEVNELQKK